MKKLLLLYLITLFSLILVSCDNNNDEPEDPEEIWSVEMTYNATCICEEDIKSSD